MNKETMPKKPLNKRKRRPLPSIDSLVHPRPFEIPPGIFSALNEFSSGGWILVMGNETGEPQVYSKFDNSIAALGMGKFCKDFFSLLDISMTQQIGMGGRQTEQEED